MDVTLGERAVAQALIDGFNKHYRIFRDTRRRAEHLFKSAAWLEQRLAVRNRVQFYDDRFIIAPPSARPSSSIIATCSTPASGRLPSR